MNSTVRAIAAENGDARPGPRIFSGHESFPCRYGWLPKLYEALVADPELFSSDEKAILRLGIGRNMIKSLRFWGEAFGLSRSHGGKVVVTDFARRLLDPENGLDPYLETPDALWRLHWKVTAHAGLGAWVVAFLEHHDREITRERFVAAVRARAVQVRGTITSGTASNHVGVFLRTYAGERDYDGSPEETLGSPFQELELLHLDTPGGVPTVRFSRGSKPTLDVSALAFAIEDFWRTVGRNSTALSFRSLMLSYAAPGAILMLNESDLHERLDALCRRSQVLSLRSDGAGGLELVCAGNPLDELRRVAWPES